MAARARPEVVLLAANGTLSGLGPAIASSGLRLRRIAALRVVATSPRWLSGSEAFARTADTIVVTSRQAVDRRLVRWAHRPPGAPRPEIWAAGPGTAEALRRWGLQRVHQPTALGAEGVLHALGRRRPRAVLHVTSDLAGTELARRLRGQGHRVAQVVSYRVRPRLTAIREQREGIAAASALVVSSPSVVDGLRRALGPAATRRIGRTMPVFVLGERTARAARSAGLRRVSVAASTSPQRFARELVRAIRDAA